MNNEEIPLFRWNTKTKEFYVLGHKFDGVNSIEDFVDFINDLQQENKKLKIQVSSREEVANKYKETIDTIKNILNNQMDYREFADIVNAIEEVIKEVE